MNYSLLFKGFKENNVKNSKSSPTAIQKSSCRLPHTEIIAMKRSLVETRGQLYQIQYLYLLLTQPYHMQVSSYYVIPYAGKFLLCYTMRSQQGWNGYLTRSWTAGIKSSGRHRIISGITTGKNGYREKNDFVLFFWMVTVMWQ